MIVHVFTAKRYHLVPQISVGFAKTYREFSQPFFILYGDDSLDVKKYHQLYSKINFKDYHIVQTKTELASCLWKYRKNQILFHAGKYDVFLIALMVGCKHIDWVCWGGDASIPKSFKSFFTILLRKYLYNRFSSIITLMEEDRESIVRDYHISPDKIITLPYASGGPTTKRDFYYDQQIQMRITNHEKLIVLLGNSPHCIGSYIEMLPCLAHYSGRIKVQCMNHYSIKKDENYQRLLDLGRKYFGDDFQSNEEFYTYDEFVQYMNKCDIYICSKDDQTGLGTIGVCLQLGKKIYIHGKNYEWIKGNYNAVVYNTDEIKRGLTWEDFSAELCMDERRHNLNSVRNHRANAYEGWKNYLSRL